MTAPGPEDLVEVHLLELPVPLAARARQHFEELMREFALMDAGAADGEAVHAPRRLTELVDTLTQRFAGVSDEPNERLDAALARGERVIEDHVLVLPPAAGPASEALGAMIEEADEYCRRGEHLLTLATPADCVAYRRWYLSEVVRQLAGETPVPWPRFPGRPATATG